MNDIQDELLKWQIEAKNFTLLSILTINGFLITVLIGMASFGLLNLWLFWVKIIVEIVFILLFISSSLIVLTFDSFVRFYNGLYRLNKNAIKSLGRKKENDLIDRFEVKELKIYQRWIFRLEFVSFAGLLLIITYLLFFNK